MNNIAKFKYLKENELKSKLKNCGIVDTHYHIGPELFPRRYDVVSLAKQAKKLKATIVLKNHTYPTTPLAALVRKNYSVRFVGSIVLNHFVGGLNKHAIFSAISGNSSHVRYPQNNNSKIVIWMPTVHAAAHIRILGQVFDPRWFQSQSNKLKNNDSFKLDQDKFCAPEPVKVFHEDLSHTKELLEVLELIAKTGNILATGHLSANEVMRLVPLALEIGVPSVIVTHPHYPSVGLSNKQLCNLVKNDRVFIEHCFAIHSIEGVALTKIANSIKKTGMEKTLMASDFGQICSKSFPSGTLFYANRLYKLLKNFFSSSDFMAMFSENGLRALLYK